MHRTPSCARTPPHRTHWTALEAAPQPGHSCLPIWTLEFGIWEFGNLEFGIWNLDWMDREWLRWKFIEVLRFYNVDVWERKSKI